MSLGAWGQLGTTLGSKRLTCAKLPFYRILAPNGDPFGAHNHTGGFQMGIGACNDVVSKGLFEDLNFTPNQVPKTNPTRCFFGTA